MLAHLKTRLIYFRILLLGPRIWEDPPHPSQLVPIPTHSTGPQKLFFTDISVSVAQIKKEEKKSIYFQILLLGVICIIQSAFIQSVLVPNVPDLRVF